MHFFILKKKRRVIAVTPLIDIVFILLIFFVLETTLVDFNTVNINFPVITSQAKSTSSSQALLIEVFDENSLWIEGIKTDISQFIDHLSSMNLEKSTVVQLEVANEVELQLLVNVIDLLQANRVENISIGRLEQ